MPDYQVKNVEDVVVGADIQVGVFTLAMARSFPRIITARLRGKLTT